MHCGNTPAHFARLNYGPARMPGFPRKNYALGMISSTSNARLTKVAVRALLVVLMAVYGLLTSGCNSVSNEENLALFAMNAPLPKIVAKGTELAAAEKAAAETHGCIAVRGEGPSMEPVYLDGTAVVIRVGGYDKLKSGLPIVYKDSRGVAVAHMLVRQTDAGWIAAGLNNNGNDVELVTRDNLVGVITQAFASKTGPLPKSVAARIALNEQVAKGASVAAMGL